MLGRSRKILIIIGIILVILSLFLYFSGLNQIRQLQVSILDVGQGDAILIQTPFGQNVLIDGGPDDKVSYGLSQNLAWWDRTIDLMILTHPHDDHVNGEIDILKRYKVKKIIYTGAVASTPNYLTWLKLIKSQKIPMTVIDQPRKIVLGEDCYLDILYPIDGMLNKENSNLNNSSIVAKLVYKNVKFLLTGDIEKIVEEKLLISNADISAHIVKIAHHGSDTSSIEEFLKKVNPEIAVISVGKDNKFGHPNGRTLNRLERLGIKTFRTDSDGGIHFTSDGEKIYKK